MVTRLRLSVERGSRLIDPTPIETILAALGFAAFIAFVIACIVGLSVRAMRWAAKMNVGKLNAEIDAKIVVAENLNVSGDPTAPFSPYAAVNEAREARERRR